MGQITRTTNPTGLREVDQGHFVVRRGSGAKGERVFWLEKFDYVASKMDSSVRIACVAYAGNTEEYFDLGSVSAFEKAPLSIRELATDRPLRFRFLFNRPGESLLIGYVDGIKALDEAGQLGSSLVDIEPCDLRGTAWELVLPEELAAGEKPNVLVERSLYPTALSAVNHPWFGVLVMPEVMRQIAMRISENPEALDDTGSWMFPWRDFITSIGAEVPGIDETDDKGRSAWVGSVVEKFCAKGIFKHHMAEAMAEMDGDPK